METQADATLQNVRLLVQINDWSLRALGLREMRADFGFLQAKPSSAFAPVAITPDELGGLLVRWTNRPQTICRHQTAFPQDPGQRAFRMPGASREHLLVDVERRGSGCSSARRRTSSH